MQNKHKKICIVSISLGKGGAERSCAMLSQMLVQSGHEVHLAILTNDISYPFEGTLLSLDKGKESGDHFLARINRLWQLHSYIKDQKFDVVIDHRSKTSYAKEWIYDTFVYKGIRRIYVVHSSNPSLYLTERPEKIKGIYNKNWVTVGVSEYITDEVFKKYGITNGQTIYNAYNPAWIESKGELPMELEGRKYLLSYGRIDDEVKDLKFLIAAFAASKVWEDEICLVIMGEGKDKKMLQQYAKEQDSAAHILFIPFSSEPYTVVRNAQFVCLTSVYEGFPMVLVESLSLGVPVLSLDIMSGPSEIIKQGENGLLISERSLPLFADGIRELSFNRMLFAHCKQNAKISVRKFSMDEIAAQWNQLVADEQG